MYKLNRVKSGCACQWDRWGRLSDDVPTSKCGAERGPLGLGTLVPLMTVRGARLGLRARPCSAHERQMQTTTQRRYARRMLNSVLGRRKALPDMSTLKPYRGKPAVRNFRGDTGNGLRRGLRHRCIPTRNRKQQLPTAHQNRARILPDRPRA